MDKDIYRRSEEAQAILGLIKLKSISTNAISKSQEKSVLQTLILERVFNITMYPNARTKLDLSLMLGLSVRTIQIWLQNKRKAVKNKCRKNGQGILMGECDKVEIDPLILCKIYFQEIDKLKKNRK